MKTANYALIFLLLALAACSGQKGTEISFKNPADFQRTDQPVTLTRTQIEQWAGKIPENKIPLFIAENDTLPSQADDLDGDEKWDEIFLLLNFAPGETKKAQLIWANQEQKPHLKVRTNVRFVSLADIETEIAYAKRYNRSDSLYTEYQMEGPAWENDVVGFRNYFDERNGIDIFGKRTPEIVLHTAGLGEKSYHDLNDWGMDVLKVANSLGAGALAMAENDSLYRLGLTAESHYKLITQGALRSIIRFEHKGWQVAENTYDVNHDISIFGGSHAYKSTVTISGLKSEKQLVTGIVNKHSDTLFVNQPNEKYRWIATHDQQGEKGEYLGMALLFKEKDYIAHATAPDSGAGITETYYTKLRAENQKPVEFYFYVGWEYENENFKNTNFFLEMLDRQAQKLANPIEIEKIEK